MLNKIFYKYSEESRRKKCELFFELMKPSSSDTLLDAGGGTGAGFRDIWNYFKDTTVIDLDSSCIEKIAGEMRNVKAIVGDVCGIALKDKSVDFVFSNAVIEHIDNSRRYLFAKEIKRIARKGYFITTPNYWFPFEPHYLCPFWQYLPEKLKKITKKYLPLGHYGKGSYQRIDLLTVKELKKLFPESNIEKIKITFLPETLVCWEKYC